MALRDVVKNAVATANRVSKSLQVDVEIRAWKGDDGFGGKDLANPVAYKAIYMQKQRQIRDFNGQDVMASSYLAFLQPILPVTPNEGMVRRQPLDPRDELTIIPMGGTALSSGFKAPPILQTEGLVDPTTTNPYYLEAWLG